MQEDNYRYYNLSLALYAIGLLVTLALGTLVTWGDMESSYFALTSFEDERLKTLSCPVLLTGSQTGTIKARFKNTAEYPRILLIKAHISEQSVSSARIEKISPELEPGETIVLRWTVSPDDAVWDRIILARVSMARNSPLEARTGTCGIFVLDIPFVNGDILIGLASVAGVIALIVGVVFWYLAHQPMKDFALDILSAMIFIGFTSITGLLLSLFESWVPGGAFLLLSFLALIGVLGWTSLPSMEHPPTL